MYREKRFGIRGAEHRGATDRSRRGTEARALFWCSIVGRSEFPAFAAKYAKRSAVLRAGDPEHKLSLPVASDAASYIRSKRDNLKGHGIGGQPMRRFSAETFPKRPVTSS
jgi:hypothetical protein